MPTVINNPPSQQSEGSGAGLIIGIIIALLVIFAFIAYGLPAVRRQNNVNLPGEVDININRQPEGTQY